eukprot:gene50497-26077_t
MRQCFGRQQAAVRAAWGLCGPAPHDDDGSDATPDDTPTGHVAMVCE